MVLPSRKTFNIGYRSWFKPFLYNQRVKTPIFILDYETHSQWEDSDSGYSEYENRELNNRKLINGIQIYFLDGDQQKHKAFLRHAPYYYLLLDENISQKETNHIINRLKEVGEEHVIEIERESYYDAANFTFLVKKPFLKVTVDRPGSVPTLRAKSEEIVGIKEWREADVLFHHRCAIDHNVRVGAWYHAEISGGEIQELQLIPNKAPPHLKILAFDIETVFEQTRDPNPNKDEISMISLFTGQKNYLLVNSKVVKTKDIRDFEIILRQSDENHPKPYVDWEYSGNEIDSTVLERFLVTVIIVKTEEELLQFFFQYIRDYQPDVITDFFGGRFDIPFLIVRSEKYNISLEKETGFKIVFKNYGAKKQTGKILRKNFSSANIDFVTGAGIIHLDAFLFNEKYSYLPKKDLGLKASTKKKLKIIPIGREALFAIHDKPMEAAAYAGCDAYILLKYVREIVLDFFFSMGQIFPVPASELLTRRSGSLDDLLIDAEDHKHQVIGKRRIGKREIASFSSGVVIESLAYTGGLVEAKRPGIWRSDLYYDYKVNKQTLTSLKEIVQKIIAKESNLLAKKVIKEELDKRILSELGEVSVTYSEDPIEFLKHIEIELLKNGIKPKTIIKQLNKLRNILEEISSFQATNVEEVTTNILDHIDQLITLNGKTQLRGVHVDVTSMYPSQIRQFKLQPSGIVPLIRCRTCDLQEADKSCFFEGDWIIKLTARRPCRFKGKGSSKCDPSVCTVQNESNCKKYEPDQNGITRSQEVFTFDGQKTDAFLLKDGSQLEKVPIASTYLGSNISKDPFIALQQWLLNSVEATQLTTKLDQNHFDIFEDETKRIKLPPNAFMSLDVRTKKITILLSVNSRVCQKAYNFVARIMDDFFNTRVQHKLEAKRLSTIIAQKREKLQPVDSELIRLQKFHDSTQIGMKVPLNSIYGLLGMKGGVRNASTPCAGITTKLSADLIHWAANQLEQIGLVTELDTDGIWLWVPKQFPLEFPVTIKNPYRKNGLQIFTVSLIDKILNEKVSKFSRNDNYWENNGRTITRSSKSLIQFEQDGPYDFQFVMGKKKYIVYNYNSEKQTWIERELTGLESKRSDFSKLQIEFQEKIINAYLEHFNPDNPISLSELYQNANRRANQIRSEIIEGRMDPSYFVKPKAINKPLRAYKSKLPQVSAAYILKDLGFSVAPGTRVQMLNIKGNHVIPRQIFDFEFDKIKEVLIKHAIATLSFMLGELTTKEDLRKLIDVRQYSEDIFGPGRIYDRMVRYPMELQHLITTNQQQLDLNQLDTAIERPREESLVLKNSYNPSVTTGIHGTTKNVKSDTNESLMKKQGRKSSKHRSLDSLFRNRDQKLDQLKPAKSENQVKIETIKPPSTPEDSFDIKIPLSVPESITKSEDEEIDNEISLITSEELIELETNNVFTNGLEKDEDSYELNTNTPEKDLMVCSECGALVNPQEITNEGCTFCGGKIISQ